MGVAVPVNDLPIAFQQLNGRIAAVFDPDVIGPEPTALLWCRLLGEITDRDPDRERAADRNVGNRSARVSIMARSYA